jgi:hypothetical protein
MEFDMSCVYLESGFNDAKGNSYGTEPNRAIQFRLMGKNGYYGGYGKITNVDYAITGGVFSSSSPSAAEVAAGTKTSYYGFH